MANNLINNSNSNSNNILKTVIIIIIVLLIAYLIYYLYSQSLNSNKDTTKNHNNESEYVEKNEYISVSDKEKFTQENYDNFNIESSNKILEKENNPILNKVEYLKKGGVVGDEKMGYLNQNKEYANERNAASFPKEQLTADELLPQDNSSVWAQVNPSGEGSLKDRNFLQSGYHIGINTVGQTLRNANLQLRSEPPCPQVRVSPWLQATIEPDVSRIPFEIGGCT